MASQSTAQQQKIVEGFQKLREEQQALVAEAARAQTELREHKTVLTSVEELDPKKRCYRQVGDTLIEHTAEEIVEILRANVQKFSEHLENLQERTVEKGKELNEYKEKHNIRLLSEQEAAEIQKKQALSKIQEMAQQKTKK
ncbi:Protein PFD-2 [Aphelenchoides avenae]|nr:Protein PFD-2 [Aphelenchus avenae]